MVVVAAAAAAAAAAADGVVSAFQLNGLGVAAAVGLRWSRPPRAIWLGLERKCAVPISISIWLSIWLGLGRKCAVPIDVIAVVH